ncbi:arylsulfatase [Alsobacter sp. R-9]
MSGGLKKLGAVRTAWRLASCLLGAAALATLGHAPHAAAQPKRPNIVLIVADDAGYADFGSFGGEIATPSIDALAAVGVRFSNFYVGPTCSPTRSMLLTGVDNHLAGLGNMAEFMAPNQKGRPGYEGHLNQRVAPVAALLRQSGYHTYMAGKWHMGEEPDQFPAARGFERDLTLIPGGGSHFDDMWGARGEKQLYTRNGKVLTELRPGFHSSVDYTDAIIGNIEEQRADGKPFFAYLAFQAPHDPFQLPLDWLDKYRGRYDQGYDATRAARIERMKRLALLPQDATVFPRLPSIPAWTALTPEERKQSARRMELYAAMLEHLDWNVGRLVRYLQERNLYEDTLFIVLSDNGPEGTSAAERIGAPWDNSRFEDWGKKGTFIQYGPAWAQVSAGPFRMFKGYESEGGIRAPMIVAGPGVSAGGRISGALSHVTDVPATILRAANVAHPATVEGRPVLPLQGRSLQPVLDGSRRAVRGRGEWIAGELFGNRFVRRGDWKLLWMCRPAGTGEWQLFDLARDPGETRDLAASAPAVRNDLLKAWKDYAQANGVIIPSVSPVCPSGRN